MLQTYFEQNRFSSIHVPSHTDIRTLPKRQEESLPRKAGKMQIIHFL